MFDDSKLAPQNGVSATVSLKDWFILDLVNLLNIIPIIGSIAAIVIYAIIAFGSTTAPSMKNRVLMSLIWLVVGVMFWLLFLFFFGGIAMLSSIGSNL